MHAKQAQTAISLTHMIRVSAELAMYIIMWEKYLYFQVCKVFKRGEVDTEKKE